MIMELYLQIAILIFFMHDFFFVSNRIPVFGFMNIRVTIIRISMHSGKGPLYKDFQTFGFGFLVGNCNMYVGTYILSSFILWRP